MIKKTCFSIVLSVFFLCASMSAQSVRHHMTEPALSPDNSEIAFVSGGDIWTVDAEGGTAQLLVSHPANETRPAYSPDGKFLAFQSNRTGAGDVYLLDLASNNLKRLTYNDGSDRFDGWSYDGEWLYFNSSSLDLWGMRDIFRVHRSGGTPQQVSSDRYLNEYFAAPSPDGSSLAFSARGISNSQWWRNGRSHIDETEIWLKTGEAYRKIADRGAKQHWPMWKRNGASLYFVSDRSGTQNIHEISLTANEKPVTRFRSGRVLWPRISYDGSSIVFERDFGIWKLNTSNKRAARVPITLRGSSAQPSIKNENVSSRISEFQVSPDGKKIVVVARGEVFAGLASGGGDGFQVTKTAAPESFAAWSSDSKKVVYSSERNGRHELFEYEFSTKTETRLTSGNEDYNAVYSGDGKFISFIRNARSIMLFDTEKRTFRKLADLFTDLPPITGKRNYAWSPDNKWVAYLTLSPENRSFTNVSIANVETGEIKPASFIANSFSGTISWSPDGEYILFDTTQRTETPSLARIGLKLRTPKFNEDKFRDLFPEENPKEKQKPEPGPSPTASPPPPKTGNGQESKDKKKGKESKPVEIDFEDIRKRLRFLPTGVSINEHVISPDGKTLLVTASAEGSFNLYTITVEELARNRSAKQITSSPTFKFDAQFTPDSKSVMFIERGRIRKVNLQRRSQSGVSLNLNTKVDFEKEKMEVFGQGWRYMRDHFYDPGFHGKDWNEIYQTYKPLIAGSRNITETRRLMNMMVGELNASHLGVSGSSGFSSTPIGRLGLRYDGPEYERTGNLRITEVIALSPAAVSKKISTGDYLVSIDGTAVSRSVNIDGLLEGKVGKRVEFGISKTADGANPEIIAMKPISTGAEKYLLYRQWVEAKRAYINKISGGRLGYVHLPNMGGATLAQLYIDLDAENQRKEGVVIDIRNNNGGFINPYVIDILSRKGYLTMQERGLWKYPARGALGQRSLERPTVLVTNQHSLSDAEDLAEGYRELKLGKIVGEKTSGWIIFTWSPTLFEGTRFRLPRSKITDNRGQNMELNPREVDVEVTNPVGESFTGKDSQLDVAAAELIKQL
ncbi:MAG: peptidase S41 [Pyrinomonadaceae bacterium]|nr:peptidase S41 [Pyrinomonadaceae bacterium]